MTRRPFGSTGVQVPLVGQGTWQITRQAVPVLRRGIELGLTHIDTAEMYGTEEYVAEAIAGVREKIFLVSKVLPSHTSYDATIRACEGSLRRLKTDHLDCYLIHWWEGGDLDDCFRAMRKLRDDGKIRSYGVSNFDVELLERCPTDIACNQVFYHLKERRIEHDVLPWCEKRGIAVVAYSPLGAGEFPKGVTAGEALSFLARRAFVIPKASTIAHVEENARLVDVGVAKIERLYPPGPPGPLPMI